MRPGCAGRLALETGAAGRQAGAVIDRLIDRLPAVLLLGVVLLAVQVAAFEVDRPGQVLGAVPAAALLFLYLRAGSGGGSGGGRSGGGRSGGGRSGGKGGDRDA